MVTKVGDYGLGLEQHNHEYYLDGDVALPIRLLSSESLISIQVGTMYVWIFLLYK